MSGSTVIRVHPVPETPVSILYRPLIDYDQTEVKSVQELLYEAARELDHGRSEEKWEKFEVKIEKANISSKKKKNIINTLDDEKHWTALHYAVDCNNLRLCKILTSKEEPYQCDVNILGGNGESVLHVISLSNHIWSEKSSKSRSAHSLISYLVDELEANVNLADDEDRTPLHLAVMHNRYFYANYLIKHGAKLEKLSKLNASVLHFALIPGSIQCFKQLCSIIELIINAPKKIDLYNCRTLDNRTPLVFLASHPVLQILPSNNQTFEYKKAIENLMELFTQNITDLQGQILLAFDMVARQDQLKWFNQLKFLVNKSSETTKNQIPHLACHHNNNCFLEWILTQNELKQSCTIHNDAGFTPLLTATFYDSEKCVDTLLKKLLLGNKLSESFFQKVATQVFHLDVMKLYCRSEELAMGNILHLCAKRQVSESLFKKILEKLAFNDKKNLVHARDNDGNLALHLAARSNKDKSYICERLLQELKNMPASNDLPIDQSAGQDSSILHSLCTKNRSGKTPVHEASQTDHKNNLVLMWKAISSNDSGMREKGFFMSDDNRLTCVHHAAANGNLEVLKYLIEIVHMKVDAIGDRRLTPLHLACQSGHLDVIKYLVQHRASTTLRTAQLYNCLEISIMQQDDAAVKHMLSLPNWREMMRNAQRIKDTEAYDTPMRKLIRYMPDMACWLIEVKLTRIVGGQEQKVCKEIYDYEFYEDMHMVKQWHAQGVKLPDDDMSCKARCTRLGVNAIFGCCCSSCHQSIENQNRKDNGCAQPGYTRDAYTRVRNHPLILVSQQSNCLKLMEHQFHISLRKKMYRRFGTYWLAFSFLLYIILVGVWTTIILNGKHPQHFYELANLTMTSDIGTCEQVAIFLVSQNITEAFKTTEYRRMKFTLYTLFLINIFKNGLIIIALFPKIFRTGAYYLEASALVLSFIYILDCYDWQNPIIFRCPIQYQIGAMGLFLSWMNLLMYVRCIPWLNIGIYVTMLEVILFKFLRFLPVLMIIICGFGFTYWMLLQNQTVFASPVEALLRTSLMTFDLGYESRLYGPPDQPAYYKLVYVIIILTAIVFCIFIINLLIGLAVGEIPSLLDQGTLWRSQMLYNLVSDYEILRLQLCRLGNFIVCYQTEHTTWFRRRPTLVLTFDKMSVGWRQTAWHYTKKHFFDEQIQDSVPPKVKVQQVDKEESEIRSK